jgi:hypothetical protein
MKSRAIQVLPFPLATSERNRAINHINNASLRITGADYTTDYNEVTSVGNGSRSVEGDKESVVLHGPGIAAVCA